MKKSWWQSLTPRGELVLMFVAAPAVIVVAWAWLWVVAG